MSFQLRWSEPDVGYGNADDIEATLRRSLRPDPILTVSEWADRFRMLSTKVAAEPGRYRTSRVPFLRDVMDALSPTHPARRVVFMKSAQVGATEAGNNWLGFIIHWSPAPVMAVWPTVETAKKVSTQRIEPLIAESPELSALIPPAKKKDSGNTQLVKSFPGGIMVMTGANSGVGLRSMPARYAFLDEVDAYPGDVDGEGDPIALVANRTTTFGRSSKLFLVSTPLVHGESRIEREFEASDQRRYFVPCPYCRGMQWLKWENLRWDPGSPQSARYACEAEGCGELLEERHKGWMLDPANGAEWRATAEPKDPGCVGFHISGLYSPPGWLSWEEMAREWEAAQGNASALKAFKNTRLGETWFEHADKVAWERIYERRETWKPGTLPTGVTILNGAVDVQQSPPRLELHVWGWGEGLESWAIERRVFPGRADDPKTWEPLDAVLVETWTHASGAELRLDQLAIDTGDQATTVYGWVARQDQARVFALKGKKGFEANAPVGSPTNIALGGRKRAVQLRSVTGDVFKAELYSLLALPRPTDEEIAADGFPPGTVHVPDFLDAEWCKQLVAEERRRTKAGRFEWAKVHQANEALDCRVYARAALWIMGVAAWKPERWRLMRERRGLEGAAKQIALQVPRSPREQAEHDRSAAGARKADGTVKPRSPREQAEMARFGTINGVPVAPTPNPPAAGQAAEAPAASWAALLKKD